MVLGYRIYMKIQEIEPNPATWFMFSYGTFFLFVLELDTIVESGNLWTGEGMLLLLPLFCTIGGITIALRCWSRGKLRWPEHAADRAAFSADLLLTVLYLAAWGALFFNYVTPEFRDLTTLIFLIGSNATALTSFAPLLRATKEDPSDERAFPWMVWALSYAVLGVATYLEAGFWTVLMIYPVLNTILHASVGILALPHRRKRKANEREMREAYELF